METREIREQYSRKEELLNDILRKEGEEHYKNQKYTKAVHSFSQVMKITESVRTVVGCTVLTLKYGTPYLLTIFVLKLEQDHLLPVDGSAGFVANSVDPDQTPRSAASDLGIHCVLSPVSPNISCFFVVVFSAASDLGIHCVLSPVSPNISC